MPDSIRAFFLTSIVKEPLLLVWPLWLCLRCLLLLWLLLKEPLSGGLAFVEDGEYEAGAVDGLATGIPIPVRPAVHERSEVSESFRCNWRRVSALPFRSLWSLDMLSRC